MIKKILIRCNTKKIYEPRSNSLLSLTNTKKILSKMIYSKEIHCSDKRYLMLNNSFNRAKIVAIFLGIREKSVLSVLCSKESDSFEVQKRNMAIRKKINMKLINLFLMTKFDE